MNRVSFIAFSISFCSAVAHSEGTLVRSGSLPGLFRSGGDRVLPTIKRAGNLGSNAVRWLGSFALVDKLSQLFQQNRQNADEINKEAERRQKFADIILKHEKSLAEIHDERKLRIKELREKILEARSIVASNTEQSSEEEMLTELYGLLTRPLELENEPENENEPLVVESKPDNFEPPVCEGDLINLRGWIAPGAEGAGNRKRPREEHNEADNALDADPVFDFGKHGGKKLSEVPIEYLLFLCGRKVVSGPNRIDDILENEVQSIWDNKDSCCTCSADKHGPHVRTCDASVVRNTFEETVRAFEQACVSLDHEASLSGYGGMELPGKIKRVKAFAWLKREKPDIVETAREYVDQRRLCWHCGAVRPVQGDARHNGADRSTGDIFFLHLKCWKELKNN